MRRNHALGSRHRRAIGALLAAVTALLLAACGGSSSSAPSSGSSPSSHPTSGKQIFTSAGCAGCHTLAADDATGSVGPNLDKLKPSYGRTLAQVTHGGGTMPSFSGSLSKAQIRAVARFVVSATH